MQTVSLISLGNEMLNKLIYHGLRITKNNPQFQIVNINNPSEQLHLKPTIYFINGLLNRRYGHRFLLNLDALRIVPKPFDQHPNGPGHRRREEDRLPLFRQGLQDHFDIFSKAHIQHDVGLIKDDGMELIQSQRFAAHVIHHTAGRPNHDLSALP
jgi:hypothetical protein